MKKDIARKMQTALKLVKQGKKVSEACSKAGLIPSLYYYHKRKLDNKTPKKIKQKTVPTQDDFCFDFARLSAMNSINHLIGKARNNNNTKAFKCFQKALVLVKRGLEM